MRAARVERTPLVAELLKSLRGQSALGVLSLSETGGKAAAGANRLPVAHIVAAKARQKRKQVVGERAERTLDEGFALRLEGRSGFLLDPEVLESGACVVGDELLAVVASHGTLGTPHARIARRSAVQTALEGDVRVTCSSMRRLQTSMMPSMVCLCPSDSSTSALVASISQSAFSESTPSSARPTEGA